VANHFQKLAHEEVAAGVAQLHVMVTDLTGRVNTIEPRSPGIPDAISSGKLFEKMA
jgi:hypothetical protein